MIVATDGITLGTYVSDEILATTIVGSFRYTWKVEKMDRVAKTATIRFRAYNIMGLKSLARIPGIGSLAKNRDSGFFFATRHQYFEWVTEIDVNYHVPFWASQNNE